MVLKLYMVWGSPPVNAVLMTAKALNLQLKLHEIDFAQKEYLKEWYLEINPSHTVPALDDDGFIIWDSHTILVYLLETYGQTSRLYYADTKEKFKVLQLLNLDCGTIFRRVSDCIKPLFYENAKGINPQHVKSLYETYSVLERILTTGQFLAGSCLSLADISAFSSIVVADLFLPVDESNYPRVKKWMSDLRGMEWFEAGKRGVETMKLGLDEKLGPHIA